MHRLALLLPLLAAACAPSGRGGEGQGGGYRPTVVRFVADTAFWLV